jgi:hypothetical protein
LIVYSPHKTSRLTYTCEVLFNRILQIDYTLTDVLPEGEKCFISYTDKPTEGIWVKPSNLLTENGINTSFPQVAKSGDRHFIFPNETPLGFDVFSAVFWMISRYEEYQQKASADQHGRFSVYSSLT